MRAVNAAEIALLVGPLVPDGDAVFVQVAHVGVAAQKPEQLVDDRFEMEFLRGEQRKSLPQIETRLRAEDGNGPGPGAIHARLALFEHQPKQIVILAHVFFR